MTARAVLMFGLLAGACSAGPTVPAEELAPVRIGVITSLTGGLASLGPSWRNAALLAEQEVNAAGGLLGGRPVELVIADDQTNPAVGRRVAQSLIEEEGVVAILGAASSAVSLEVADVTGAAAIPQVSCCSTSPDLTSVQPETDRYLFRTVGSDLLQGIVMADHGYTELGCRALAMFHLDDAYGLPFGVTVTQRFSSLGGTVVATVPFEDDQGDYRSEVQSVLEAVSTPDCAVIIGFPESAGKILRDWHAEGGPEIQFLASDGVKDQRFADEAGLCGSDLCAHGVVGTAPLTAPNTFEYTVFEGNFETVFGTGVPVFGSFQYDAAIVTMLAIEAAGTTDGSMIRDGLYAVSQAPEGVSQRALGPGEIGQALLELRQGGAVDYAGAGGPVDFDSFGDVISNYEIWRFDQGDPDVDSDDSFVTDQTIQAESIEP